MNKPRRETHRIIAGLLVILILLPLITAFAIVLAQEEVHGEQSSEETQFLSLPDAYYHSETETEVGVSVETGTKVEVEVETVVEAETEIRIDAETRVDAGAETKAVTGVETEAGTEIEEEICSQRHPGLTADEALFADYLAGDLQHLAFNDGNYYYDGKLIYFPPTGGDVRPEQVAVKSKGFEFPTRVGDIGIMGLSARGGVSGSGIGTVVSNPWIHGDTSTTAYFTLNTTYFGNVVAFCEDLGLTWPSVGAWNGIQELYNDPSSAHILNLQRLFWFGYDGPGMMEEILPSNLYVATVRILQWLRGTSSNNPANSNSLAIRTLWSRIQDTAGHPIPDNPLRIFFIAFGASHQDLMFSIYEPKTEPEPEPQPGSLRIVKTVPRGESRAGFQFDVHRMSDNHHIGRFTTNATGYFYISDLEAGDYRITEIVPSGWILESPNPQIVTVVTEQAGSATPSGTFHNVRQTGDIIIQKVCSNSALRTHDMAGAVFEVRNADNTVAATVTTNSAGRARLTRLQLGAYTIREITAPTGYQINTTAFNVTISPTSLEVTVNVPQEPQRGRIIVEKYISNPYYAVHDMAGAVFNVRANNAITRPDGSVIWAADALVTTIRTNANGRGESVDIPLGSYRVYEATAPYGYALNTSVFNVNLTPVGQTQLRRLATRSVPQRAQTGTIDVLKRDYETGDTPQGDANLEGAIFAIYAAEDIVRWPTGEVIYRAGQRVPNTTLTVRGNPATARSRELPLGNYEVVEITRPHGYMPDLPHSNGYFGSQNPLPMPWQNPQVENEAPTRWPVNITPPNQAVIVGRHSQTVYNHVIQGRIWIIKHGGDDPRGEQQVNNPLEGAIFRAYLTSAGSWENAVALGLPHVEITTNDEGMAYTPYLPYGRYTVEEVYAPGDWTLIPPFERYITNNPENHRRTWNVIGENVPFEASIQINKVCAVNGARIPVAGVPFRLFDVTDDEWMSFELNYPMHTQLSVFRTNEQGWLLLPDKLQTGTYRLYEQAAPHGYVLREEPLEFVVHSTAVVDWERYPITIEVDFPNEPVRGQISIEKRGEMLADTKRTDTEFGIVNTPVWEECGLQGVVFDIIAAEDIITPCGTVRAHEGEVVDTLVTDQSGYAITSELFLGRYYVAEVYAHHGFVIDGIAHEITLSYADQYTPIVFENADIVNVRQRVSIMLEKWMETHNGEDAPYGDVVFGLFAYDDIHSYDGTMLIPGESGAESEPEEYGIFRRLFNRVRDAFTPEQSSLVAVISVNDSGIAEYSGELPLCRYVIRELQTADGYLLTDEEFPVVFEYAGQDITVVAIAANNGKPAHNYLYIGNEPGDEDELENEDELEDEDEFEDEYELEDEDEFEDEHELEDEDEPEDADEPEDEDEPEDKEVPRTGDDRHNLWRAIVSVSVMFGSVGVLIYQQIKGKRNRYQKPPHRGIL